jgi:hypothetical protein
VSMALPLPLLLWTTRQVPSTFPACAMYGARALCSSLLCYHAQVDLIADAVKAEAIVP